MRCLALAQAWQDRDGKVTFISSCENDALRKSLINEGVDFFTIAKPHPELTDLECTLDLINEVSKQILQNKIWIVIDGYHFDAQYQKTIKDAGYKILWIDDYGHANYYYADLILNQNISADESFYAHRQTYSRLLLGTRYALLRREFKQWQGWRREIPKIARKVFVTLGGSDPDNVTLRVIKALKRSTITGLEAKIIVGPANPNLSILEREINERSSLKLITNAKNIPELMAWADIAISAGGSTCWEMALLGLPNMIIYFAENQRSIAEKLHEIGSALNVGSSIELSISDITQNIERTILDSELRKEFSINSQRLVDGLGVQRVCQEIA
jgi:UDP-2,4-diacetamido-2,4,6-trideoxy-beta-L-altropyranose hydrolase